MLRWFDYHQQSKISNIFNNYFATIAEKTKENINTSHKHF